MLGHDHVSIHHELIALLGFLQDLEKAVATACRTQDRQAMIATAGDEVEVLGAVVSLQPCGHGMSVGLMPGANL